MDFLAKSLNELAKRVECKQPRFSELLFSSNFINTITNFERQRQILLQNLPVLLGLVPPYFFYIQKLILRWQLPAPNFIRFSATSLVNPANFWDHLV